MRDKLDKRDADTARIAARQHGVVYVGQLAAVGLSRDAIARRVKVGRLHRVHRGVYAVGHPGISHQGRWMAAVLACGRPALAGVPAGLRASAAGAEDHLASSVLARWGAALSHRSAAELWMLLPPREGPVDVTVEGNSGRSRRSGLRLHRSLALAPAAVASREGIPVTTPSRTLGDLRWLASRRLPGCTRRELRRATRQAEVLGLRLETDEALDRTRSELERRFLLLCRRAGLPAPENNVRIGPHEVDFLWRRQRLVVETDGYRFHRGRAAFEDDRQRGLDLRAHGFEVVRLTYRQVIETPADVAAVLAPRVGADGR